MMKVLVIIPAFNEAATIEQVLRSLQSYVPDFDIVVVNDGSSDKTETAVLNAGIPILNHPINLGYGAAIQTGLKYAVLKQYDYAVLMDADGQHDPLSVPQLFDKLLRSGTDVVIGSRFLKNEHYKMSCFRVLGIKLFSFLTFAFTGNKINDITSGFQAMNRVAIRFLSKTYPIDFPDAQVIIMLILSGFKVTEIPAVFHSRQGGVSMFNAFKTLYYPFKIGLSIIIVLLRTKIRKREFIKYVS